MDSQRRRRKLLDLSALSSILLSSHSLELSTGIYLLGMWHVLDPVEDMEGSTQRSFAGNPLSIHGGGRVLGSVVPLSVGSHWGLLCLVPCCPLSHGLVFGGHQHPWEVEGILSPS